MKNWKFKVNFFFREINFDIMKISLALVHSTWPKVEWEPDELAHIVASCEPLLEAAQIN